MHPSAVSRLAAAAFIVMLAGCDKNDSAPTGVRSRSAPVALRTPNVRTTSIRQRVAAKRHQGLSSDERARLASLSGKWKWVADLHHQAMQEAIHDGSTGGPRKTRPEEQTCGIMQKYGDKYAAMAERTGGSPPGFNRQAFQKEIAQTLGVCGQARQASVFATAGFRRGSSVFEPTGNPAFDSVRAVYRDYVTALLADIHTAKDLGDANEILDHYLVAANNDPAVSPSTLNALAGTVDLARSSAEEWDTYARAHQGSLFVWGWLSDLGDWIAGVFEWDVSGCAVGFVTGWQWVEDNGGYYGGIGEAAQMSAAFCGIGAFGASLYKAFAE